MGIVIGMDEAGLGPNLGPLVITATVWGVPGDPRDIDFWSAFDGLVTRNPPSSDSQLQIADSKQVYSPQRGFDHLETGVLAACGLLGWIPISFRDLTERVTCLTAGDLATEPWFADRDVPIPVGWLGPSRRRAPSELLADSTPAGGSASLRPQPPIEHVTRLAAAWAEQCHAAGVHLRAIRSDVVLTQRFNQLTRQLDNKAAALSRLSLQLLRQVWSPDGRDRTLVLCDKHGGRNRYHDLLAEVADGKFIFALEEGPDHSRYRIGTTELAFQTRSEQHLPVALASMVCKYLREVAMELFNSFWQEHAPGVKPTAGYPVDARRFRDDIETARRRLNISDDVLWRER